MHIPFIDPALDKTDYLPKDILAHYRQTLKRALSRQKPSARLHDKVRQMLFYPTQINPLKGNNLP